MASCYVYWHLRLSYSKANNEQFYEKHRSLGRRVKDSLSQSVGGQEISQTLDPVYNSIFITVTVDMGEICINKTIIYKIKIFIVSSRRRHLIETYTQRENK